MFLFQRRFIYPVVTLAMLLGGICCVPLSTAIAAPQLQHSSQTLAKHFYVHDDVAMRGITKTYHVNFSRPSNWEVKKGTSFLLKFSHSTALLPDISFITVSINGVQLQSTRLVAANARNGSVRVPLPPRLLTNYNVLGITVEQHYTRQCEYPFNSALWTMISNGSSIDWAYLQRPTSLDLMNYESIFNNNSASFAHKMAFLYSANASSNSLTAISQISGSLAQLAPFKLLSSKMARSLKKANLPTIIVGTPQEQPIISRLSKHAIPAHGGVLQLVKNPYHPHQPILLVTGKSSADVTLAARALVQRTSRRSLRGPYMVILKIKPRMIPLPQNSPRLLPDKTNFTLADLGVKDQTVRGYYGGAIISFPISPPPNAKYYAGKTSINLHYAYSGGLDGKLSTIEVRVNNTAVGSIALKAGGSDPVHQTVRIPTYMLQPQSNISIVFHLIPKDTDYCKRIMDNQVWGTVFSDTTFHLPHDDITSLPDLKAMATGGFPFTRDKDMSKTLFVLPASPQPVDQDILLAAINRIALYTNATAISPQVTIASALTPEQRKKNNLIVIGSTQKQPILQAIAKSREYVEYYSEAEKQSSTENSDGQITHNSIVNPLQKFLIAHNPYLSASDFVARGVMEELLSPWNSSRVILVLTGRNDHLLARNINIFTNPDRFSKLQGNLALLEHSGAYRTFDTTGPENNISEISASRRVVIWLRGHISWIIFLIILVLLLLLFSFFRPRFAKSK